MDKAPLRESLRALPVVNRATARHNRSGTLTGMPEPRQERLSMRERIERGARTVGNMHFEATETIDAPPAVVWDILTDYHNGHPLILPKEFGRLEVEQGGKEAGTIMRSSLRVFGTTRRFRHAVSTPEPGRVLVEADTASADATSFTLDPVDGGARTRVRIATDVAGHGGLMGIVEGLMAGPTQRLMERIYRDELAKLETVAKSRAATVHGV